MLRIGAYANAKSQNGSPLIFDSLNSGNVSLLKAFTVAGADVNAQFVFSEEQRMTLLGEAGKMSEDINPHQLEQMKCLLNAGADPNRGSQSILAVCTGECAEGCWSNPREVHLLLQHGAKLRKGDATAILNAALDDDDLELLHTWLTLPVPTQEQRAMLNAGIRRVHTYNPGCADKENRATTIAFLQHELQKMKNGPRSPKSR